MQISIQRLSIGLLVVVVAIVLSRFVPSNTTTSQNSLAQAQYQLGVEYRNSHQNQLAIDYYTEAIRLNPRYASAYAARCSALASLGRYFEAIEDCNRAIELAPDLAWVYGSRCAVLAVIGQVEQAIADCSRAIDLDPTDGYIYDSRGTLYAQQGQNEQAIADYTRALEHNPEYSSTYYNRGLTYLDLGEKELALADFEEAINRSDKFFRAYYMQARTHFEIGQTDIALEQANEIIVNFPDNSRSYFLRGWMYDSLDELEQAAIDFEYAIQLESDFDLPYWFLANIYYHNHESDLALQNYCQFDKLTEYPEDSVKAKIQGLGGCPD